MTLPALIEKKRLGEPIVMVTAYDYPSARAVAELAGVDLVLIGDSGAMTVLGYPSTVQVELDELLVLATATRRGLRPRSSSATCPSAPTRSATSRPSRPRCASSRRPAATPSSSRAAAPLGRARARDRQRRHPGDGPRRPHAADLDRARRLQGTGPQRRGRAKSPREALALQEAGCFAIVFEAIPSAVSPSSCR